MILENQNIKIEFIAHEKNEYNKIFINRLFDKFNKERQHLLEKLQIDKCRKIKIILFDNREQFIRNIEKYYISSNEIPFYCRGTIQEGIIYFLIKNTLVIDSYEYEIEMRKIIHEFIHILYNEYIVEYKDRIVWLDEGIAINLSNERRQIQTRKI